MKKEFKELACEDFDQWGRNANKSTCKDTQSKKREAPTESHGTAECDGAVEGKKKKRRKEKPAKVLRPGMLLYACCFCMD